MSLLHTDSFMAYGRFAGDDVFNGTNGTARLAHAANLRVGGYEVVVPNQTTELLSQGFLVRTDPVVVERNSVMFSNPSVGSAQTYYAAMRRKIGGASAPIIGGFSLFIPVEYIKSAGVDATILAGFHATPAVALPAVWAVPAYVTLGIATEIFRIGRDLQIRWGADAPQSSKVLKAGSVNYIEYRIDNGEVRVWIDDALVLQKTVQLLPECVGMTLYAHANMVGAAGRWAFGNMYNVIEDAIAPAVRLGPTTRVIGVRPDADIEADFARPGGFSTNASVVGQDLVDNPTNTLQGIAIGDQDIYSTAIDTATASGVMVHAVAVKVMAANLDSARHALRPMVISGVTEGESPRPAVLELLAPIGAREIFGMARRPSDGKIFACGAANSIYSTPANGDGTAWTTVMDDASAGIFTAIAIRADGMGVICRSDCKFMVMLPGSDTWNLVTPTTFTYQMKAITVMPSGKFVACGASGRFHSTSTPDVPASWVLLAIPGLVTYTMAGITVSSTGRIIIVTSTSGSSILWTSDDSGATWIQRLTGMTTAVYQAIVCTGTNFYHGGYTPSSGIAGLLVMKSLIADTVNWMAVGSAPGTFNFLSGAQTQMMAAAYDSGSGNIVFVGQSGSIFVSNDGLNFKQLPRLTTQHLNCVVFTANGDWLAAGGAGALVTHRRTPIDCPIVPLSGYQTVFNYSNVDPATGLPWTPAAAAATDFGMRVAS